MSPIGRVFIVLNLALAASFLVVSGTYLQKQDSYKKQFEKAKKEHADYVTASDAKVKDLVTERNQFEVAKSKSETALGEKSTALGQAMDENKALAARLSEFEGSMKQLQATAAASLTESKAARESAQAAFNQSVADQKTRDEAVRTKDTAVAENRDLKDKIAKMEETATGLNVNIKTLESDKSQLQLLVKVAESYGFIKAMAAPNLSGVVTTASPGLCAIQVTDNPGKINIKEAIELGKWGFAIYDASGYKGEAIATSYEESANAVLCKVQNVKGEIKQGDKAATKTP
jgi:uncharacterized protein (DUF3084 family)